MIIDDEIFNGVLTPLVKTGISYIENTDEFYHLINNREIAAFIYSNNMGSPQFMFLYEMLQQPELSRCPMCGNYNENIECPIIRCENCDHEWKVETLSSDLVCNECTAYKLQTCEKKVNKEDKK